MKHLYYSAIAAFVAFLVSSLVGYSLPVGHDERVSTEDAEVALDFAFPGLSSGQTPWISASGRITHTGLYRRAYVTGSISGAARGMYSEQILKIGWPFTIVRGFVRHRADQQEVEGAWFVESGEAIEPVRFLPIQPVWPGVLLYGILGALGSFLVSRGHGTKRDRTPASDEL